jgi:ABC-type phosphate/phosphonate transport system permease subunit
MYVAHVLGRFGSEIRAVARGSTRTHGHLRDRIVAIIAATIGVNLICAALALAFEKGRGQIHSFGSALFWTSTQLLTVSSQFPNPLSTPGRILDVFMEAYAISVVATLAAVIGAFLLRRARELEEAGEGAH